MGIGDWGLGVGGVWGGGGAGRPPAPGPPTRRQRPAAPNKN